MSVPVAIAGAASAAMTVKVATSLRFVALFLRFIALFNTTWRYQCRASGRVALPVKPKNKSITDFPDMLLEDSDRLSIPHTPSTVSVVGDVYNPGSFIYEARNTAGAYLEIAGKGKPQSDLHHAFVLRANGVVVAANNVNGLFTGSKFERVRLYPGDQIVVPYKLPTGAFVRGLQNWTQISSQLAITAAALAVVH